MLWPWPPLWLLSLLHFVPLPLPPELRLLSLSLFLLPSAAFPVLCSPSIKLSSYLSIPAFVSVCLVSLSSIHLCVLCLLCPFAFSLHVFLFSPGHLLAVPVSLMSLFYLESLFSTQTHADTQTQTRHTCKQADTDSHM